jgi:hypothetical protein
MEPPRPLIVTKLNSKKDFGFFEPFRPPLDSKTEDNVPESKLKGKNMENFFFCILKGTVQRDGSGRN